MAHRTNRKYSLEFKLEAVRLSNESGKPVTQVARDLNINPAFLYRWRDELHKEGPKAFPGKTGKNNKSFENAEIIRLRRELKKVTDERDILKKTLVFFAAEDAKNSNVSENNKPNTP
jgi:transposase